MNISDKPSFIKTGKIFNFGPNIAIPEIRPCPADTPDRVDPTRLILSAFRNSGIDPFMAGLLFTYLLDNGSSEGRLIIDGLTKAGELNDEPREFLNGHGQIEILTETLRQLWRRKVVVCTTKQNEFSLKLTFGLDPHLSSMLHTIPKVKWTSLLPQE